MPGRLRSAWALLGNVRRAASTLLRAETLEMLGEHAAEFRRVQQVRLANPGARVHADVLVQGLAGGTLRLAAGVSVGKGTMLVLGDDVNGYGALSVGAGTWIGQYDNLRLAGGADIAIGEGCLISQFCSLVGANHPIGRGASITGAPDPRGPRGVSIGDGVWIGAGAAILPGVSIGQGAVIGANSVLTKAVGAWEIWAGVPAVRIGMRD